MEDKKQTPLDSSVYRSYSPLPKVQAVPGVTTEAAVKKRHPWLLILLALIIIGYLFNGWLAGRIYAITSKPTPVKLAPTLPQVNGQQMESKINALIAAHPELDIGVSIIDIKTSKHYTYGVADPFGAASTAKLLTAAYFLHQVEAGKDTLSETVAGASAQTELEKMIVKSDNTAWLAFNDTVLGNSALQSYAKSLGLNSYQVHTNSIDVDDLATLLQKLYNRQLINSTNTNLLLSYMKIASEREYIPAAVPTGVTVYHKVGWLDDRFHDAAIIDDGKRPYALVIMTKNHVTGTSYSSVVGQQLFHDITHVTNSAFLKQ